MERLIPPTIFLVLSFFTNCNMMEPKKAGKKDTVSNIIPLSAVEIQLFDGKTLKGWHGYNQAPGETIKNWSVIDSELVCLGTAPGGQGGDLVTNSSYENFELAWEWKIEKGSNSGAMYHVIEESKYKAPWETGPEYQLIDDAGFPQKLADWQKTGADYAMHPADKSKQLNPPGEWNRSKIIFDAGHVEHWLNGKKIVEFEAWTPEWNKKKMEGKWKDYPDYGQAKTGKIALQDHGNRVYYRNIVIREF